MIANHMVFAMVKCCYKSWALFIRNFVPRTERDSFSDTQWVLAVEIVSSGAFENCCRSHSPFSVHSETYFSFASVASRNRSMAQETVMTAVTGSRNGNFCSCLCQNVACFAECGCRLWFPGAFLTDMTANKIEYCHLIKQFHLQLSRPINGSLVIRKFKPPRSSKQIAGYLNSLSLLLADMAAQPGVTKHDLCKACVRIRVQVALPACQGAHSWCVCNTPS